MPPQSLWLETNPHNRGRNLQPVDGVQTCPAQPAAAEATPLSMFAQLAKRGRQLIYQQELTDYC